MRAMIATRFLGIDRLYGTGSAARLARCRVAVIGLGGVGSWAAEALARSGIGGLTLIDGDEVCVSNVNRQSHALEGEFGRPKVEVMAARLRAVDPRLHLDARAQFLTRPLIGALLDEHHDLILDACDAFRVKLELIAACRRAKQPIIVVGSAGGRTDATRVRVRDLAHTEHDKLLGMIRKKLRQDHGFPRNVERSFGVPAVYSLENVRYPQPDGSVCGVRPRTDAETGFRLDCGTGLGAAMHVTAAFACAAVGRALYGLLHQGRPE
ncbi:MAG TPA: tRNA threonylcarbamoyladenosine dehydratase [Rhodanobacteraceae bacterium]|nr:tRNA threonylcarbamoyladenosine dehydratase [Rhodanobacteraceae bacterium]